MTKFRKLALLAVAAAVTAASVPTYAQAGWRGHNHHYHHRGGGGSWVPFALVGGLAAGALIASSANSRDRYDRTYYAPPPPPPNYATRPCHVVNRLEDVEGYTVKMAATMCYDSTGTAYIVQGSQHPVDESYDY